MNKLGNALYEIHHMDMLAAKARICPVEVKSSKAYSTVSLDDFAKRYSDRIGDEYVLHPKQLKVEGNRQYLPLYMSFCL